MIVLLAFRVKIDAKTSSSNFFCIVLVPKYNTFKNDPNTKCDTVYIQYVAKGYALRDQACEKFRLAIKTTSLYKTSLF